MLSFFTYWVIFGLIYNIWWLSNKKEIKQFVYDIKELYIEHGINETKKWWILSFFIQSILNILFFPLWIVSK